MSECWSRRVIMVMDDHKKPSPFASAMGGGGGGGAEDFGGPKFTSNFPAEKSIVFGSGGAATNYNNSSGSGAAKRGRGRPRSASPIFRQPTASSQFAGHQQDAAGIAFGKSPDQQRFSSSSCNQRLGMDIFRTSCFVWQRRAGCR